MPTYFYPMGDSTITVADKDGNINTYELGITDVLRQTNETYDEYILENGQAQVIRRINEDGTIKETEEIEYLGELKIELKEGTNTISILNYTASISVKYAIKSDYTDIFATRVEMNAEISKTAEEMNAQVSKKIGEDEFSTKLRMDYESVQIAWNKISEYIQFINAELQILGVDKTKLMTLDKLGQHFYEDDGTLIGDMGIVNYNDIPMIAFNLNISQDNSKGMAWGVQKDDKFYELFSCIGAFVEETSEYGAEFNIAGSLNVSGIECNDLNVLNAASAITLLCNEMISDYISPRTSANNAVKVRTYISDTTYFNGYVVTTRNTNATLSFAHEETGNVLMIFKDGVSVGYIPITSS